MCSEHGEKEERQVLGKEAFAVSLLCVSITCVLRTGCPPPEMGGDPACRVLGPEGFRRSGISLNTQGGVAPQPGGTLTCWGQKKGHARLARGKDSGSQGAHGRLDAVTASV